MMCNAAIIISQPAYELHAKLKDNTLQFFTRFPIANHPEPHLVFQVTANKDDLLFLADFIRANA